MKRSYRVHGEAAAHFVYRTGRWAHKCFRRRNVGRRLHHDFSPAYALIWREQREKALHIISDFTKGSRSLMALPGNVNFIEALYRPLQNNYDDGTAFKVGFRRTSSTLSPTCAGLEYRLKFERFRHRIGQWELIGRWLTLRPAKKESAVKMIPVLNDYDAPSKSYYALQLVNFRLRLTEIRKRRIRPSLKHGRLEEL